MYETFFQNKVFPIMRHFKTSVVKPTLAAASDADSERNGTHKIKEEEWAHSEEIRISNV